MRQRLATVPTTYMLEDLNDVQVAGLFYEPEMVLVRGKGKGCRILCGKNTCHKEHRKGQKQVLIKWKGYPNSFNSWEPGTNLV